LCHFNPFEFFDHTGTMKIIGKRGERQFGIDILDVGGQTSIYAAQCKLREEHKSLAPSEIQAEVDEAKKFTPPLGIAGSDPLCCRHRVSARALVDFHLARALT
jgi:hypothetical protein